ncbi:MAG: ligase-associated DNA damage response endonuclease PdeM [Parvularculaceae bacterium]
MNSTPIILTLCGERLTPDPSGALYWPARETLIVADLHFEKGSSFARRGVLLPPYDTRATIRTLAALMRRYAPKRVISLGDAFHDGDAEARMASDDAEALAGLIGATQWIWVLGNHDPAPPARFASAACKAFACAPFVFRHEPRAGAAHGEIAGHLHPAARIAAEGRMLRRRCFASDGRRLVMPAMGAFAGGLNILDDAFAPLFARPSAWVLGDSGVYPIAPERLVPDSPLREVRKRA